MRVAVVRRSAELRIKAWSAMNVIWHAAIGALIGWLVLLGASYCAPPSRVASDKPPEPAAPGADPIDKTAIGCALFGLTLYGLVGLGFAALVLMFIYGLVVLVFRYTFGIELPFGLRHDI
jgi:hypothetical protein